tara:strand:- start:62 stop:289 length:228 start_codon:yes stop_codon:yes gene_type:complete
MKEFTVSESLMEVLQESIQHALNVCYKVEYGYDSTNPADIEKCAPYAIGYTKSTLESLLDTFKSIQANQTNTIYN